MDYTLVIIYANGETLTLPCATMIDVTNWMNSSMHSQFAANLNRDHVTFQVIYNKNEPF